MDPTLFWKTDSQLASPTVVHALESFPDKVSRTIFLAGPTPRSEGVDSWRPEMVRTLGELGFDGHIFLPEPRHGAWADDYHDQVEWEAEGLCLQNACRPSLLESTKPTL